MVIRCERCSQGGKSSLTDVDETRGTGCCSHKDIFRLMRTIWHLVRNTKLLSSSASQLHLHAFA